MMMRETIVEVIEKDDGDEVCYRLGYAEPYEPWTDDPNKLLPYLKDEYGTLVSNVYVDRTDGTTLCIGWVFDDPAVPYEDGTGTWHRQVWVEFYDKWEQNVTYDIEYADVPEMEYE